MNEPSARSHPDMLRGLEYRLEFNGEVFVFGWDACGAQYLDQYATGQGPVVGEFPIPISKKEFWGLLSITYLSEARNLFINILRKWR